MDPKDNLVVRCFKVFKTEIIKKKYNQSGQLADSFSKVYNMKHA